MKKFFYIAFIFLFFSSSVFAQAPVKKTTVFTRDQGGECVRMIKSFMEAKRAEFGEIMNDHFRSAKPTSDLIPLAVESFREYRADVKKQISEFVPKGGKESAAATDERAVCEKAAQEDFKIMKELLYQHIIENASAKKSTRLLDKYKQINEKLQKLNVTIGQMYGYFGTMAQKIPCYATKCSKL